MLTVPDKRLLGRRSIPPDWAAEKQTLPFTFARPEIRILSQELAEESDLRHFGDPLLKAFAVKHYLEKNGYYTLKEKHVGAKDPAASFLFGNFGDTVFFAHAAVQLPEALA